MTRSTRDGEKFDIWKEISRADLSFLTADRPSQVGTAYRKVLANANPFEIDAARRNLLLFRELGVLSANVEAALKEMKQAAPEKPAACRRGSSCSRATCWTRPAGIRTRRVFPTRPRLWPRRAR